MRTILMCIIVGYILGTIFAQYSWRCLREISKREEDISFDKHYSLVSFQTTIFSATSALLWGVVQFFYEPSAQMFIYGIVCTVLLSISVVDWLSYEIPPQYNLIILVMGIINLCLDLHSWVNYIVGAFLVSGVFFLIIVFSKGKAMGGGDMKMMFVLGLLLGWKNILLVMFLGSLLGSIIHISIMKITKDNNRILSFGPYLALGAYITIFWGNQIIDIYTKYFIPQY